ncbi:uncharacterized protein LOC129581161 isoform X2 [Paramacrobiotus metropolitanus]|uniref:uncharacterized protein LOC129581161 isoform X2 n=1 Tax=Paramacrobiotus metropolitanus TaxID=2943436 RepID=UPI0024461DC9|nr:uncharacterized protein LOC129581161 isoform X2 [Paramacrobiotus metropolitanus]
MPNTADTCLEGTWQLLLVSWQNVELFRKYIANASQLRQLFFWNYLTYPWICYSFITSDGGAWSERAKPGVLKGHEGHWILVFAVAIVEVFEVTVFLVIYFMDYFYRNFELRLTAVKCGLLYSYFQHIFWPTIPFRTEAYAYLHVWIMKIIISISSSRPPVREILSGWYSHHNIHKYIGSFLFSSILKASCESVVAFWGFSYFLAGCTSLFIQCWHFITALIMGVSYRFLLEPDFRAFDQSLLLQVFIDDLQLDHFTAVRALATKPTITRQLIDVTKLMGIFCVLHYLFLIPRRCKRFLREIIQKELPLPPVIITILNSAVLPMILTFKLFLISKHWMIGNFALLFTSPQPFRNWLTLEICSSILYIVFYSVLSGFLLPVLYVVHLQRSDSLSIVQTKAFHKAIKFLEKFENFANYLSHCGIVGCVANIAALWEIYRRWDAVTLSGVLELCGHVVLFYVCMENFNHVIKAKRKRREVLCFQQCALKLTKPVTGSSLTCYLCNNTGDDFLALPCTHSFHKACLKIWFVQNCVCPVCRKEIYI